jgi:hypothetical protein
VIGHYLLTLTGEQENRVLGEHMIPGALFREDARCLLGVTMDVRCDGDARDVAQYLGANGPLRPGPQLYYVGLRYDNACKRFGAPRVNAAIRQRILDNRLRRELAPASRETAVVAGASQKDTP